jgi:hypothetical protein
MDIDLNPKPGESPIQAAMRIVDAMRAAQPTELEKRERQGKAEGLDRRFSEMTYDERLVLKAKDRKKYFEALHAEQGGR